MSPEEAQGVKTQDTDPTLPIAKMHIKGMTSVSPDSLHVPIRRKVLNLLTWDMWFSLINNHHLMLRLPAFTVKFLYDLVAPLPPWSCSLRVT